MAKRPRAKYSDTVSVLVGSAESKFVVHSDIVCKRSKFFKAACSGQWKEATNRTVKLPIIHTITFRLFLDWLYAPAGSLMQIIHTEVAEVADNQGSQAAAELLQVEAGKRVGSCYYLCSLWIVADFLDAVELQYEAIDGLLTLPGRFVVPKPIVTKIWENTAAGSGLRLWLIDQMVASVDRTVLRITSAQNYPAELMFELLMRFVPTRVTQTTGDQPNSADRCKYHKHLDGEKCV